MQDAIRRQYLEAMGIETYVPRRPLPGAAPSPLPAAAPLSAPLPEPRKSAATPAAPTPLAGTSGQATPAGTATARPPRAVPAGPAADTVRFSLAAVFAGGIAWVELLEDRPLAREQVQLVAAMARALRGPAAAPQVTQFDWPTHNNPQLDRGREAARDALAAFLGRHLEERGCSSLVMLGSACEQFVVVEQLPGLRVVRTRGTLEMLADAGCKRLVWRDLRVLAQGV